MNHKVKDPQLSPILVCLDGSPDADAAAAIALDCARTQDRPLIAAHVYDAGIHQSRFRQMEPGLPQQYQAEDGLTELRNSHGTLMSDGFEALSRGYMEWFLTMAEKAGVRVKTVVEEGRNYVGLLKIAGRVKPGLTALGAAGLGYTGDGIMGSTAARLMHALSCDLLIGRASSPTGGPVLAGIDGSEHATASLEKAQDFAGMLGSPLHLLAAYDPELHQRVFKAMADSMPPEAQAAVGLDKQKDLHESLIDDGLGTLYRSFLDEAAHTAMKRGEQPAVHLVADKGYRGILEKAGHLKARMICLGRFGHNREEESDLGATAETVARLAPCHVHLAAPPRTEKISEAKAPEQEMPWEPEALERLQRAPRFVRKMAQRAVERAAREEGAEKVTVKHFEMISERFRPGKK